MKPAPTLVDQVYRLSFQNETCAGWRNNADMRHAFENARRFVLDESMAGFMAELANETFIKHMGTPVTLKIADSLRVSARLPHEAMWLEYPLRAYQRRSSELRNGPPINPKEIPWREGWLIQQHPRIDSAHIMHLWTQQEEEQEDGFSLWTFPFAFAWCSDDNPLPWRTTLADGKDNAGGAYQVPSSYLVGLAGYERDNVNCVRSPLIDDPDPGHRASYSYLLKEWTGILRRVWALLATIDHLPITHGSVRQSKGFLARHRIRKYLDHHTITLNVPAKKDTRVIARKAIAHVHRRRHDVRAHWRDDWRNPPSKRCNPHIWECVDNNADVIACEQCHGRQFYIHKHERGTAESGLVIANYLVKHEPIDA